MQRKIYLACVFSFAFIMAIIPLTGFASSVYMYTFNSPGLLQEAFPQGISTSPYWWVNSGGAIVMANGVGETMQGNSLSTNKWHIAYAASNPVDTDNGLHPQNIFRLVSQQKWQDYSEQAYFKVTKNEPSSSPNKNQSNGLLFFNRYQDSQNLYYAGIRVDGTYVIKKKINSTYYTMAQAAWSPNAYENGQGASMPNLIPENQWIGLRTDVTNNSDGSVSVKLYSDLNHTGKWTLVLQATDSGQYGGTKPITTAGYVGIRTDFMDVQFDNFKVTAE